MPLSRTVCWNCVVTNREVNPKDRLLASELGILYESFLTNWENLGWVLCPVAYKLLRKHELNGPLFPNVTRKPPFYCPYFLEHWVDTQNPEKDWRCCPRESVKIASIANAQESHVGMNVRRVLPVPITMKRTGYRVKLTAPWITFIGSTSRLTRRLGVLNEGVPGRLREKETTKCFLKKSAKPVWAVITENGVPSGIDSGMPVTLPAYTVL